MTHDDGRTSAPAPPTAASGPSRHVRSRRSRRAPGPRIYNLFPLLVGRVSAWTRRTAAHRGDGLRLGLPEPVPRDRLLAAASTPSPIPTGSTRASATRTARSDDEQIRRFCAAADAARPAGDDRPRHQPHRQGRAARAERPDLFVRDAEGELESPYRGRSRRSVEAHGLGRPRRTRLPSRGRAHELDRAIWDGYIARLQGLGVAGFRCDAAYKVPPDGLARPDRRRPRRATPDCLFAAETLGCTFEEAQADRGRRLRLPVQLLRLVGPQGVLGAGAVRAPAPARALDRLPREPRHGRASRPTLDGDADARSPAHLKARYALAAFFSAGVLMPIGYEWGYRRALHVVETTPDDREHETGIDISGFDRGDQRAAGPSCRPRMSRARRRGSRRPTRAYLALLRFDAGHAGLGARSAMLVLPNPDRRAGAGRAGAAARPHRRHARRLRRPHAGGRADRASGPAAPSTLAPGEVRILAARRPRPRRRADAEHPTGEGRVVIEAVTPELDGGRTPVKRVVGESVEVEADIFSRRPRKIDGRDPVPAADEADVAARARWRFVDNDRWGGALPARAQRPLRVHDRGLARRRSRPGCARSLQEARGRRRRAAGDDRGRAPSSRARPSMPAGRDARRACTALVGALGRRERRLGGAARPASSIPRTPR